MKINKFFIALSCVALGLTACNDFDEVNTDPSAFDYEDVSADYFLNNSIEFISNN